MDSTVKQMLAAKDLKELWTLKPDDTVLYALEYMAEKNVGALPVMEDEILIGIFSERDYARIFPLQKDSPETTPVSDVMTEEVFCIGPENSACDCMGLMTEKRIRHLPVVEGDKVVGMMSIGDLVKAIIAKQAFLIAELEQYIKQ